MSQKCMQCERELTFNEIGAHKKFINRGSRSFVPPELIDEKIEYFKLQGCTLFV